MRFVRTSSSSFPSTPARDNERLDADSGLTGVGVFGLFGLFGLGLLGDVGNVLAESVPVNALVFRARGLVEPLNPVGRASLTSSSPSFWFSKAGALDSPSTEPVAPRAV